MNRFEYTQAKLREDESFVSRDKNVKLYNGDDKTSFEDGEVVLTTHRLFWGRPGEISKGATTLCLQLKYVVSVDEETASSFVFGRKQRIILNLRPPMPDKAPGPMDSAGAHFIKLSGRNGLDPSFSQSLKETINARIWEVQEPASSNKVESPGPPRIKLRTGIVGIERSITEKHKQADENITLAFQDLKILMAMAKDMVALSKVISTKIREHNGAISEDETVRFKSYLMSLGIDDPVIRDDFTSNKDYFRSLSRQICEIILDPIEEAGGMMPLAEVYCRVNRARGLELLSPEDLMNACTFLDRPPVRLKPLASGAYVLQLDSHDDQVVAEDTLKKVEEEKSLSVDDFAKILAISILMAKERLLSAERFGLIVRDESIEGLRFYPNMFLQT